MNKKKWHKTTGYVGAAILVVASIIPFVVGGPDSSFDFIAGEFTTQYGKPANIERRFSDGFETATLSWPDIGIEVKMKKDAEIEEDRGWFVTDVNKRTPPLFLAVQYGNLEKVKELVRKGLDMNMYNHQGVTPLMYAVDNGEIEIVRWLLEQGAKVDKRGNWDPAAPNPLIIAAKENKTEIMELLFDYGADPNPKTLNKHSILYKALFFSSYDAARMLIREGTEVERREINKIFEQKDYNYFRSAIGPFLAQWAEENNRNDILKILNAHGIEP
ncbi:MAG: ankyrin repeat domain-containing protein [Spirochaetia bacterium]